MHSKAAAQVISYWQAAADPKQPLVILPKSMRLDMYLFDIDW